MRASLDMYTEGGPATRPRRLLQPDGIAGPCPCPHCARYGGPGYRAASRRQPDDSHLDGHRDSRPPRRQDVGGRASRGGHRSPQRQPAFRGPAGPCSRSDDSAQLSPPRELNPAQRSRSSELAARHCPSFRERCDCVTAYNRTGAHPFHLRIPHPLPHLRVNGQVHGYSRTVHCDVFVDRGEDASTCALQNGQLGHCAAKRREADVSGENWNGHPHKGFFPTEVPQTHFARDKPNEVCICGPLAVSPEAAVANRHRGHVSFLAKQATERESVRDQIRQVVTDLEDVLGGLKQIHVEMKEVVDQIDHLTANMDLDENPCNIAHRGELAVSPPRNRKRAPVAWPRGSDEERVILRTNSPSPVNMASVVKTRCFTSPGHTKDLKHTNGHPPLPSDHKADNPESRSQNLNPQVVISNSTTTHSRTQKPPLYPHNGFCGKDSHPSSKTAKTPAYVWRGRQNNSSTV